MEPQSTRECTIGLLAFIEESNRIEGILREPSREEVDAHVRLLSATDLAVPDIEAFVRSVAGARLRVRAGMDVLVGAHRPPPGGPAIERGLHWLIVDANLGERDPYRVHIEYETLHPFTDGNGRSGRALWAWMMRREGRDPFALPFLHRWYYDSLGSGMPFSSGNTQARTA